MVLLESDRCGAGPSGRNGGFVNAMWFGLPALRRRFGDAAALRLTRAAQEAVEGIGRWCEEQRVDAWYRAGGYLQVSTAPAHDGSWQAVADACAELGVPRRAGRCPRPRCGPAATRRSSAPGPSTPAAATVQPARLALGLRSAPCSSAGSPSSRARGSGARPRRARASRHAPIAAACAPAPPCSPPARRWPATGPLRRRLTVASSHMVITEPVPDVVAELGWTGGEGITDSRAMIHYFRTTPDGRIAFGWGGGRIAPGARLDGRVELDRSVVAKVERHLVRFFPGLAGRRIEHAWGGPIDVSPTHLPVVGSVDGGRVHYAFGYTGNGVGPSHLAGRALASLALDRRDEATTPADRRAAAGSCAPRAASLRSAGRSSARRCFAASASRRRAGGRAR